MTLRPDRAAAIRARPSHLYAAEVFAIRLVADVDGWRGHHVVVRRMSALGQKRTSTRPILSPLYPRKRTSGGWAAMSAKCHKQT